MSLNRSEFGVSLPLHPLVMEVTLRTRAVSTSSDSEKPVEYDVGKLLDLHVDLKQLF